MELEEALKLIESQKKQIENGSKNLESLKSKTDELLSETKKAKAKAKEEAELLVKVELEKAKKDGDYEALLANSEASLKNSEALLSDALLKIEKVEAGAAKDAHERAVSNFGLTFKPLNDHSMSDLSLRLKSRTKVIDGKTKVLDKNGDLTVSTLEDLKNELIASGEISHLIEGSKASGGGAKGAVSGQHTTEKNPFKKGEHFNLTKQGQLIESDPVKADKLKGEAKQ